MNALIEKYLNAETSPQEERLLKTQLEQEATLIAEEKAVLIMLQGVSAATENPMAWMDPGNEALYDQIVKARRRKTLWQRWSVAATVALILTGTGTHFYHQSQNCAIAYVYGEKVTDKNQVMSMVNGTLTGMMDASQMQNVEDQLTDIFNH